MSILTAKNIVKTYSSATGPLEILKGITFEIKPGEIVALMGPSGCGKSTLLNILGTLDKPDSGTIEFNGLGINTLSDSNLADFRIRNIGFVFQFHHLLPELTVWENLALPMQLAGSRNDLIDETLVPYLKLTGLDERAGHYPSQLSGGERQRAAVIRALVNSPGIIFADEPTGNLDEKNGTIIMQLIQELRATAQQTFLIATHSRRLAGDADRVLEMGSGLIISQGHVDSHQQAQ